MVLYLNSLVEAIYVGFSYKFPKKKKSIVEILAAIVCEFWCKLASFKASCSGLKLWPLAILGGVLVVFAGSRVEFLVPRL